MVATKTTDLAQVTAPANADLIAIATDPAGSPITKKGTVEDVNRWAYGGVSVTAGAGTQTLSAATWTKITQFTAEDAGLNVTASHSNDKITLTDAGRYEVAVSCSFVGAADEYRLAVYWNSAIVLVPAIQTIPDANEHHVGFTIPLNATLAAKDVELYAYAVAGNICDLKEASLWVNRIG